ncbi:MAG: peptide chain release factor-like protein [Nitrospirae bacterium]|nr:peptide chain release factor-like protein [Nitrospirota bacterium]
MFPVGQSKEKALAERMARLGIFEEDLSESFVPSSGPGGQHVNRSATCVVLRHQPTGITVRCQQERSQALNRFLARRLLADKIENRILGRKSEEQRRVAKMRRQKRRRSRRAKEKVLRDKHAQSEKKAGRAPVTLSDWE